MRFVRPSITNEKQHQRPKQRSLAADYPGTLIQRNSYPMPTAVASPLGSPVPAHLPHAVSVSLPTWQDNVDYEEGASRVVDVMKTGYPRFFIHRSIQKLAGICEQKFGMPNEKCMIFPCDFFAKECRDFMTNMDPASNSSIRIVQFFILPEEKEKGGKHGSQVESKQNGNSTSPGKLKIDTNSNVSLTSPKTSGGPIIRCGELHIVLFPTSQWKHAKAFWQHTGMGISSRLADHCLDLLNKQRPSFDSNSPPASPRGRNRHYFSKSRSITSATEITETIANKMSKMDQLNVEENSYLEERYARNLPASAATDAKKTLKRRIAGVLLREGEHQPRCLIKESPPASPMIGPSTRGVANISEDDVFLLPGGMCAIWHSHQTLLKSLGSRKSICWGFPYVDTLKILQKWGPGCYFFGNGTEYDELETLLEALQQQSTPREDGSEEPPVLALFCEVTSNPLLKTPDLRRLRALADKYDFAIVVDETIGNYANVEVLPFCDIVVSSLTKIFSGETNVMGGGMILNPQGRHYSKVKPTLLSFYKDIYWAEDALFLERNSRDFKSRVYAINKNAEAVCDLLYSHSIEGQQNRHVEEEPEKSTSNSGPIIKKVYYPKWMDTEIYNSLKTPEGGFGGLLSVTFTSPIAAKAFFDGLGCEKGPSLGTNFTLACPFVILAHYTELEWAMGFGIDPHLVRISVGLEKREKLLGWIEAALQNAENAVRSAASAGTTKGTSNADIAVDSKVTASTNGHTNGYGVAVANGI